MSGYRKITLLFIVIFWFLIQGIALGQGQDFLPPDKIGSLEFVSLPEMSESREAHKNSQPETFDMFTFPVAALLLTVLAGIMSRFKTTRPARPLFLMGSLILFGFINGGCPCIISSFQHVVLMTLGVEFKIHNILWFLGIVLITYFFGRVWCGWICHLGALQEFLYSTNRLEFLKGNRAQKVMRRIRYALFAVLIIQLITTQEILFRHVDPFKVAFNFSSYYRTGWILLGILIITSIFIYRPFCRAACPVGLLLGCIHTLPGASVIKTNENCMACGKCAKLCASQAIDAYTGTPDSDCIMCGDCLDHCTHGGVSFDRQKCVDLPLHLSYSHKSALEKLLRKMGRSVQVPGNIRCVEREHQADEDILQSPSFDNRRIITGSNE
jgi:ferredoxin